MPEILIVSKQKIEITKEYSVIIDDKNLTPGEIEQLAINDGFNDIHDFFRYFDKQFIGEILHFTSLKY